MESASKEAKSKKTSWKSRNFLKVKIEDKGGRMFSEFDVPPAIQYMDPREIKMKNTESAYDPIKYVGNQFTLPTAYRKRPPHDASHSFTESNIRTKDVKAILDYSRAVSKRINILKNRKNKFFARYDFDKRLKSLEVNRNTKIENSYKNKLSYLRESELKRGYDILSLESHFKEPLRERKIPYVNEVYPDKEKTSLDGYKPSVKPSVWDMISRSEDKRSAHRSQILDNLKTSHSHYGNDRLLSKRKATNPNIKSALSLKSNLSGSKRYEKGDRDSRMQLRASFLKTKPVVNEYTNSKHALRPYHSIDH